MTDARVEVNWPTLCVVSPKGKGLRRMGASQRYFKGKALGIAYGKGALRVGHSEVRA